MTSDRTSPAPREHRVQLPGGRYRYLSWGDRTRTPLVLLHGRTSLADTWSVVAPALAEHFHVIAFEQRGHGESSWDAEARYNLDDFVSDYAEFVDTVVGGPHLLIGHSMGSCTALVYAGRNPDKVIRLVLEDGGPPGDTVKAAVEADFDTSPTSFPSWEAARDRVASTHAWLSGGPLDERTDLTVRPGEGGAYYWRSDVRGLLGRSHTRHDEAFENGQWQATGVLEPHTLFLWASRPPCLVEPEIIDRMVEINPRIRKVTFDSGHEIHEEHPDLFLATVIPFLLEGPAE